ncbi:MAG TPA: GAF domain-containing protein [Anaerolineae bacterium]|nr:GAF domain-containing protein [Anaerolineae bacterium]
MKGEISKGKARVLIVEDDTNLAGMVQQLLEPEGFSTLVASSGEEALQILRDGQSQPDAVDLILLDVVMPGLNGYEVCRSIKGNARLKHIPVIMVTALDGVEERVSGLEAGADDYITKPFCREELVARVKALLRMSEMEREMARLYQESESRAAQIAAVNRITGAISSSLDIHDVYQTFFTELKAIVEFDRASLALLDASRENLTVQVLSGEAGDGLTVGALMPLADSAQGYTVMQGKALLRRDLREEQSFALDGKALAAGLLSDISVPLVFKTKVLGALTLGNRKVDAYSDHDLEILCQVAGQLAAAIENARLFGELERRLDEVQALFTVGQSLVTTLNLDKVLGLIVDAALKTIPVAHKAVIHFLDETDGVLVPKAVSHHGQGAGSSAKMRVGEGVAGRAVVEKEAIYVSDTRTDPRFVDSGTAVKSLLVVPMILGETVIGTLSVDSGEAEAFTQDDERLLVMLANQAAIAIENARLYGEAKRADELAALNRMATAMASTLDLDQVLTLAMEGINETLRVEAGSLLLLDEAEGELVPRMTLCGEKSVPGEMTLSLGQGVAGWVVQEGKPLLLPDTRQEGRLPSTTAQLLGVEARSVLCVPLVLREKTIGAIEVINIRGGRFTEDDLTLLNSMAASVAIAIENARLYAEVKDFADELARSQAQLIQSEKLAATGKLAASIAHELNNPLQAVQSCVYLVADQIDPDDPGRRYLDIAREELDRMARIVGRMVDFYRPSGEGRVPADVNSLLGNVVALVRKRLQQGGIEVDLELAPDLPLIVATGDHLKQVFLNIIINALEAMPQGGRLEIATRHVSERGHRKKASADAGFVEIEFADTGVGIPAEHINNIFDPFFTTKSKGMGLGLSVSYGIVERHGGQIQVKSKVGEGTTFTVRLPVEGGR